MIKIPGAIPINIHPLFWLTAVFIGWINTETIIGTTVWIVVILISVMVHELGHALTAKSFGQTATINLMALGGLTQRWGGKLKLWQEFAIVFNGPLAGIMLYALSYKLFTVVQNAPAPILYGIQISMFINLVWTILNLIPVQPLDGGHLLRIVLESIFGFRGTKIALFISTLLSVALCGLCFVYGFMFGGLLFIFFAFESFKSWRSTWQMVAKDQDTELLDLMNSADEDLKHGDKQAACVKFQKIREETKAGVLYTTATECLAQVCHEEGHSKEAYELLLPISKKITPPSLYLLQQLAYEQKQWEKAIEFGKTCYQEQSSSNAALINALCYGILGEVRSAVGWLQSAKKDGISNLRQVVDQKEFDKIRSDPLFQKFVSSLE